MSLESESQFRSGSEVYDYEAKILRKIKVSPEAIQRIINLQPSDPNYPLERPFEERYKDSGPKPGTNFGEEVLEKKYAIAKALIDNGNYKNLRFLVSAFIPVNVEVSPEILSLRDLLQLHVREALLKRGDGREKRKAEDELEDYVKDVSEGNTLDAKEFRKLVGLFGASRVVDILYRSRPEFRGIPIDRVKGVLADYLGDFLVTKGGFNLDDIDIGRRYLSDPDFQAGMVEVVKDSALAYFQQKRKEEEGTLRLKEEILEEYLKWLRYETAKFQDANLNTVVEGVAGYYQRLFAIQKPPQLVDALRFGRDFPDIGQLINMLETKEKGRVALADDMGLGKSASFIVAKEWLGVEQAVVIIPSNVISTWQKYLSDQVDNNGRQIGYFKPGMAPKILIVEDPRVLEKEDTSQYGYILISQERLNGRYTKALRNLKFDALCVDEVHKLKNLRSGVRAANLMELAEEVEGENKYLVLLSGTPVPNKVEDVAMILKLLYPERFRDIKNRDLVRMIIQGDYVDLRKLLVPRLQMKRLTENVDMPILTETTTVYELSPAEKEIYEVLMEDDEIEAKEKIKILRQFLLNPELLNITPGVENSKVEVVSNHLNKFYQNQDKGVLFVNGYIEGVIRGEQSILATLDFPEGVEVRVIHGEISSGEREKIQQELAIPGKKMLVLVSGQTADVGIDFSSTEALDFYNEGWTRYEKMQQLGRGYREGLQTPLSSKTFIAKNTIEEGIHKYIEAKYQAVEKLLRGIPLSVLEQELLEKTEDQNGSDLEVNPELAEYYFSSWDRMRKIFSYVKEIGEQDFIKFLTQYGQDYAQCYADLGSRSYQANASRVVGTLIDQMMKEREQNPEEVRILDLASGPEMLRRHILDDYSSRIVSIDINPKQFTTDTKYELPGKRVIGSFLKAPFQNQSFDYVNLSLALHYAKFIPSQDLTERLEVLREIHRVLRPGGRAVLNLIYSLGIKDFDKFNEVAETTGFKVVSEYSGLVSEGDRYRSDVLTLEKVEDYRWTLREAMQLIEGYYDGIKFAKRDGGLRDSRKMLREFGLGGRRLPIAFNQKDYQVLLEEEQIMTDGQQLKTTYGSISGIPKEELIGRGFVRILLGRRYGLFKRLQTASGVVVVK